MNFKEIKTQGFSFGNIDIDMDIVEELYDLPFNSGDIEDPKQARHSGEYFLDVNSELSTYLRSDILSICEDEETFEGVSKMGFMACRFEPGDFIALHKDLQDRDDSFFHFNMWLPVDSYEGREFIHGELKNLKRFKPALGDCVLISNFDDQFWHGVSPMIAGNPVVSINGFQILPDTDMRKLDMRCKYYGNAR